MGVLDKFLDAIKLNDEDDEFLDEDVLDDDDEFLDDEEPEKKPRRRFLDKFGSKKNKKQVSDDYDDELDELDELDEFDEDEDDDDDDLDPVPAKKPASSVLPKRNQPAPKPASSYRPSTPSRSSVQREERPIRTSSSKITPMRPKRSSGPNVEVCVIRPLSMENTREIADTLIEGSTVILNLEGIDVELAQRIIDFTSGACYSLGGTLQKVSSYIFVLGPSNVDITGDLQSILGGSSPSVSAGY